MDNEHVNEPAPTDTLPCVPDLALFMAMAARKLGATFHIDHKGRRYFGRPEGTWGAEKRPQLPGALPHEEFHNDAEWKGALKFLEFALRRLEEADREFVFAAMTSPTIDDRELFDFRDLLA